MYLIWLTVCFCTAYKAAVLRQQIDIPALSSSVVALLLAGFCISSYYQILIFMCIFFLFSIIDLVTELYYGDDI